jgi:hypothetical protein
MRQYWISTKIKKDLKLKVNLPFDSFEETEAHFAKMKKEGVITDYGYVDEEVNPIVPKAVKGPNFADFD